jgi:2-hydroxymuconate-semialdehyde hydrolase
MAGSGVGLEPADLVEARAATERLLPRFGVPVARGVVDAQGGATHYLEAGTGPAVLLLHGGFGGAGNWYRTLGSLSQWYRVVAPDRPGYGLTRASGEVEPVAWLDGLIGALRLGGVALVGHAGGGALALAYAQARPAAVRALALSDLPLVDPSMAEQSSRATALEAASGRATSGWRRPPRVEAWGASVGARFDDRRALAPEYLYYLWCLARLRPEQDQRPPGELAPGPVLLPAPGERTWPARPCLLVWGKGNRWTGVPLARLLHVRIPDAWLRVIDHSKGIPNLEQPGEFNHALMSFLARVSEDQP